MSAAAIRRKLDRRQQALKAPTEPPSARAIGRIKQKFENESRAEQTKFQYFNWPEAMEPEVGALPWEASRSCLDLLAYLREHMGGRPSHVPEDVWRLIAPSDRPSDRPQIDFLSSYWKVTQAAPSASVPLRLLLAVSIRNPKFRREAEACLAYAPWESNEKASTYEAAVARKSIPPFIDVGDPYIDPRMRELFRMFGTDELKDIASTWNWLANLSGWESPTTREVFITAPSRAVGPGTMLIAGQQRREEKTRIEKGVLHGRKRSAKKR